MDKITKLKEEVKTASGKEKVDRLNDLAFAYYNFEPEKAEKLATQALVLAKELVYKSGIARSYNIIAVSHHRRGNFLKSLNYYTQAVNIFIEIGDKQKIASVKHNIGAIYEKQGNYDLALEFYLKALAIWEKENLKQYLSACYNNIGIIYQKQELFEKSLEYHFKSLKIKEELKDIKGTAISYNNLGIVYEKQGNYEKALENYLKALKIKKENGDKHTIAVSSINIANIYNNQNNNKALEYYFNALDIFEKIDDKFGTTTSNTGIGLINIKLENYSLAQEHLTRALQTASDIGAKDLEASAIYTFSVLYEAQEDFKQAIWYHKRYAALNKEIYNEQKSKQIAEIQAKYEIESKEKQAEIYRLKNVELANVNKQLKKEIKERKKSENELKRSETRWQFAVDGSALGLWDWNVQTNEVFFSSQWKKMLGHDDDEISGNAEEWDKRVHPDDKEEAYADIQKHFKNISKIYLNEHRLLCKDNTYKWIQDRGKVVSQTNDGKPLRMIGTHTDITERKLAEDKLKKNEQFLNNILESVQDGVSVLDKDLTICHVNGVMNKWYRKNTPLEGKKCYQVYHNYNKPCNPCPTLRCLQSGKTETNIVPGLPNSPIEWIELYGYPIKDSNSGEITGVVEFVRDITERTRIKKELIKEKEYYHSFVNSLGDWVWEIDMNGIHTYSNSAVESILGYKVEDVVRRHIKEFWGGKITPKSLKSFNETLSIGKGWKSVSGRFKHKNGSIIITESTATPIYDSKDILIGYRGVDRDITKRKNAEEALKQSEARLKILFEAAPDAYYIHDSKGTFIDGNNAAEKLLGYSKKELIRKSFFKLKLLPKSEFLKVSEVLLKNIQGRSSGPDEIILNRKDGKQISVAICTHPVKINNRSMILGIARDITDLKKKEGEIKTSRERLKMLNKIIRHDLSNDFIVIKSALNIYRRTGDITMFDEIDKRVKKSLITISNYKKYESFINLNAVLNEIEVSYLINNLIDEYPNIKFNINGKCKVFADEALNSVFSNLISNSIKHGNSTQIDFQITSKNNFCIIKVIDNGKGIPDKIKDKIFDEGFKYGKAAHTGIGLHIVRQSIERFGGNISVEDNKPKGTVFIINLRKFIE